MRKRNWHKYNRDLVERGSLSFFIDPKLMKAAGSERVPIGKAYRGIALKREYAALKLEVQATLKELKEALFRGNT